MSGLFLALLASNTNTSPKFTIHLKTSHMITSTAFSLLLYVASLDLNDPRALNGMQLRLRLLRQTMSGMLRQELMHNNIF